MDELLSRRDLLRAGAALGAGTLAYEALGGRSVAAPACRGSLRDIEHIVILMQENRSFDQFFGTFPGVRGFDDIRRDPDPFYQRGYRGKGSRHSRLIPFRMDARKPVGQCVGDIGHPTHDWTPQHLSWNGGRNDRFYEIHAQWDAQLGRNVMGYYDHTGLPYFWALAGAYTLCDMYFCSVIGPTEPNRLYSVSATLDPDGRHGGPCLATHFNLDPAQPPNGLSGPGRKGAGRPGVYDWTTMPEQLQARGINWKSYSQIAPQRSGPQGFLTGALDNPFPAFRQFVKPGTKLYERGIAPTYPDDFERDLARDELPAVSWIQVSFDNSEHPQFAPALGEYSVDQALRLIWRHPRVWRKTAVIINHDENGGFFDHVAPPVAPKGARGEWLTIKNLPVQAGGIRGPIGLGFRVPCIIVSPWTRGGFVCSDTFDHTSVLRLIETRFGAEVPNLSRWRRSVTGDLSSAFNFAAAPSYAIPRLPRPSGNPPSITGPVCANPFPAQFTNQPLPYPLPEHIPLPRQRPGKPRRPSGIC